MLPQWIIEKKRDGQSLSPDEIEAFVGGYAAGEVPDYQMAALAMAVYFRGMDDREVTALTEAMLHSGNTVDTSRLSLPTADKHSTGGIGDKVSLLLAPLAACCGVAVPMISGRGLGITGGTLDKLESIPGYRTDLPLERFLDTVEACGCSIVGQTAELAPADKKLYALRDVTGTVPSIPLIAASIMSKKLAEGAASLVLDVKCGSGAFMKTRDQARELGRTLCAIGRRSGRAMAALVTDMNQPLGRSAGNALEVAETVAALQGRGPADLVELTLALAARMLTLAGAATSLEQAEAELRRALGSGEAFEKLKQMTARHGGDPRALDEPDRLPAAPVRRDLSAPRGGFVAGADADLIGRACLMLGAGRRRVEDAIDPAVGVADLLKVGEPVDAGGRLLTVHAADEAAASAASELLARAFVVEERPPRPAPLIAETLEADNPAEAGA